MSYVLEPGDPGYDEQGFGCCDGEDAEDPGPASAATACTATPARPASSSRTSTGRRWSRAGSRSPAPPWSSWKL